MGAKTASSSIVNDGGKLKASITTVLYIFIFMAISFLFLLTSTARTTFKWYWQYSGDHIQAFWDRVIDIIGDDPFTLWVYVPILLLAVTYLTIGTIFTIIDMFNPPISVPYKIQAGVNAPLTFEQIYEVIYWVSINLTLGSFIGSYIMYICMQWRGYPPVREVPTFGWMMSQIAVMMLVEETGFYYTHRLLHTKYLYKWIHKRHHQWTAPISLIAIYCDPIEFVIGVVFPLMYGITLIRSHVFTAYIYSIMVAMVSLFAHCGYSFPFFGSTDYHDYHHQKFNKNYGTLGFLDMLHGTYAKPAVLPVHVQVLQKLIPKRWYTDVSVAAKLK